MGLKYELFICGRALVQRTLHVRCGSARGGVVRGRAPRSNTGRVSVTLWWSTNVYPGVAPLGSHLLFVRDPRLY